VGIPLVVQVVQVAAWVVQGHLDKALLAVLQEHQVMMAILNLMLAVAVLVRLVLVLVVVALVQLIPELVVLV
jgi:hypothetical protein